MSEIHVLPRHLVNKIAAGEVIERPASVVKELVENALDAGATAVDVTVEDGGKRLIAVRDSGAGMTAEDLALAFAAHATSKIADEEDLFRITSMGFRGEALAAVRAVSQAHIVTRRRADDARDASGCELRAEGETIHAVRPAAAPEGTTVTVRNLFFNTPARRKFLRTAATEFGHVVEQLCRLALPHRQVAFSLTHNGRATHRLPATESLRQRAGDCFGAELAEGLLDFADEGHGVRVSGLLGRPSAARGSGRWQYFFVNGRFIRDRFLGHALREAYRGLIEPNRWPAALVFLEMDPSTVDVNVHPAKVEVRFHNGRLVHSQLLGAIREALNKAELAPSMAIDARAGDEDVSPGEDARRQSLRQALADFFKSAAPAQQRLGFSRPAAPERPRPAAAPERAGSGGRPAPAVPTAQEAATLPGAPAEAPDLRREPTATAAPPGAIQIHNSYIVAATDEGLAIIDQHALHERILFEELSARIASGNLTTQRLLIPEAVEVGESEKAALADRADLLRRLGVEVSEFGPNTVAVQAFPSLLVERKVPAASFLRDLLDLLGECASSDGAELLERAMAAMACKAAIKAGDPLTDAEIGALLARRCGTQRSSACPHGRPTTLTLTLDELDRQFRRT